MKVLLVEDDASMRSTLERTLGRRGFHVVACADGRQALAQWREAQPDAVMLDLSLPGLDGLDVLKHARGSGLDTPVLILTARGTVGDRVLGLNSGADDYLATPFDLDELEARLRALVRRRGAPALPASPNPSFGDLSYDRENAVAYCRGEPMELTPRESAFLGALLARPGQAVAKDKLFDVVFAGEKDVQYEAIEVVAYRVRKKLAATGVSLVTLRGLGYLLKAR
jgi:two-component system response regulator TctD